LVQIVDLVEDRALLEIEVTAVIPDEGIATSGYDEPTGLRICYLIRTDVKGFVYGE
jgi:hypothetical protein